jgi:hypothetical protein
MSLRIAALLFLLATTTHAQQPHWYVLLEPGNERWYHGENALDIHETVTGYDDGYSVIACEMYHGGEFMSAWEERWLIEPDGDVWYGDNCYIDMPLEVGKNWGRTWGEWNQYYDWFTIIGWFDTYGIMCIVIAEELWDGASGIPEITVRWYADGIGLTHWTATCAMCYFWLEPVVVATRPMTWGDMKAMFE